MNRIDLYKRIYRIIHKSYANRVHPNVCGESLRKVGMRTGHMKGYAAWRATPEGETYDGNL